MAQQPRIALRPPPHRDYLQGYPGIPASDPSRDPTPFRDPLFQLPHLLRPQAYLSGTVEIRSPSKGPPIRAKWLSLELEKIETIPPQSTSSSHPNGGTSHKSQNGGGGVGKKEGKFVELIGTGPSRLWIAGEDQGSGGNGVNEIDTPVRKKGFKGIPFKKNAIDEEDEDFDQIPDGNYPFKIPLPEGLPPSIEVDFKSSGISYQLVASLCIKGKKGVLKGSSKPTILLASASIILHKADILPVFPAYSPILLPPIPTNLPWFEPNEKFTVGESREDRLSIRRGFGQGEGSEGGEVKIKVTRKGGAFGPGDQVPIFVELEWNGNTPIRLNRLDCVLREQITFRYPSPNNPAYLVRSPPRTNAIFSVNANGNDSNTLGVLYTDAPSVFSLTGTVPASHMRVTVRTAKHIDVAYQLKVRAVIEGGEELSIDQWPVVIGNVNARVARGIISDIGYVEGLCDRPGLSEAIANGGHQNGHSAPRNEDEDEDDDEPLANRSRHLSMLAPPPPIVPSPQVESPATYSDAHTEKRQLLEARSNGTPLHVSNPSHSPLPRHTSQTPERPSPIRPQFSASPTAEEEKKRYYEAATRSRDTLQQGYRAANSHDQQQDSPSPNSIDPRRYTLGASDVTTTTALTDPTISSFAYHEASVLKLTRPSPDQTDHSSTLRPFAGNDIGISRSNTTLAASGSQVSITLDEPALPRPTLPPTSSGPSKSSLGVGATMLGRSLTSAESEKKRLFLEAKEMARVRQEEARLALERQNKVLEDFEFEEAQRDFEESLIIAAEEERRKEEESERERFERRLEEERLEKLARFEREQREAQEKRQAEADRWARERKEEDEMKKRKAEELRRQDEEKEREESERRGALARKVEMERLRAEDEQRRLASERARREEAERRYRAQEEEDRRRQEESERRLREEYERRLQEDEHRRRVEQERRDEEENRRIYLEQVARLRAEEEALAQRANNVDRQDPRQIHPSSYGRSTAFTPPHVHSSMSPQRVPTTLDRAPSVASFAPSTSAANADSAFYAQAIASGQHSALSAEKAEYLRQLRQGQSQGHGSVPSPPSSRQQHPSAGSYYTQPLHEESLTRRQVPEAYSSPPRPHLPQESRSRSTTPTPQAYHPVAPPTNGYKSAAEEKSEAAARRRAEDTRLLSQDHAILAAEEEDFAPPSYPVPGSSVNTAPPRSAAEEKEELSAYYRAKQAVESARAPPPVPPSRQPTVPSPGPAQSYPSTFSTSTSNSNNCHHAPSAPPPLTHQPHSSPHSSELSHPRPRDSEVSLGKQRADTTSTGSSYPESILRNYTQTPSAPPPPSFPTAENGTAARYYDDRVIGPDAGGGFDSFHLETRFPEFDRITERIRHENNHRS
ncbi:hypothetical protein JCM16303_001345 [Sporobolomyces ruberrimus]